MVSNIKAYEQLDQSIFISSRLWKSKRQKLKFPNKLGTNDVKQNRAVCAKC